MISGEQHFRDAPAPVFDGSGVLGKLQEPARKAVVGRALRVSQHAGKKADHSVGENGGRERAIGQDVIADGDFIIDEVIDDPLIDAFVVAAEHDEARSGHGIFQGDPLVEAAPRRRHEHHAGRGRRAGSLVIRCSAQRFHGLEERLAFHHHPLAAAVRRVVGRAVFVASPIPQIVRMDGNQAPLLGLPDHALGERRGGDGGEKGKDIDAHGFF